MVSIWPWKGDNNSPESFEKALSALSAKLTTATGRLEGQRQSGRRFKALWTLYTSIAYLFYGMVALLVVGWQNWGVSEYTAVAGAPLIIYLGRLLLSMFYDYRVSRSQSYVNSLQKERDTTIAKLKAATKYDSTQQLLEKYGGTPAKPKPKAQEKNKGKEGNPKPGQQQQQQQQQQQGQQRTGFVPPPTANIPGRGPPPPQTPPAQAGSPQVLPDFQGSPPGTGPQAGVSPQQTDIDSPGFAPNAYSTQYYAQPEGPKWYDRIMDVLLGEDEMNPKNRLALICSNCRLVNGQAPPGIRTLEEVGKWRCSGCGSMNGEESEAKKLLAEIRRDDGGPGGPIESIEEEVDEDDIDLVEDVRKSDSDVTQYSDEETVEVAEEPEPEQQPRKRGRPKGSKNKKT